MRFLCKNIINTRSNLSTKVLKEISWRLGLEYKIFEHKEKLIDVRLVRKRNHIAHGEALKVDGKDFIDLGDEVIKLMSTFHNLIENSAICEQYKNVNTP